MKVGSVLELLDDKIINVKRGDFYDDMTLQGISVTQNETRSMTNIAGTAVSSVNGTCSFEIVVPKKVFKYTKSIMMAELVDKIKDSIGNHIHG